MEVSYEHVPIKILYSTHVHGIDFAENETLNRVATEQSGLSEGDNFTMANFTYATSVVVSQMVEILHNTRFPGISVSIITIHYTLLHAFMDKQTYYITCAFML